MLIRVRFLTAAWMILVAAVLTGQPTRGQDAQFKVGDRLVTTRGSTFRPGRARWPHWKRGLR